MSYLSERVKAGVLLPYKRPVSFGKSPAPGSLSRLHMPSKTGLPVGLAAGANTGVLKSKTGCPHRLPGITARLVHEYLKRFSRIGNYATREVARPVMSGSFSEERERRVFHGPVLDRRDTPLVYSRK
jgi:hypothetical protein